MRASSSMSSSPSCGSALCLPASAIEIIQAELRDVSRASCSTCSSTGSTQMKHFWYQGHPTRSLAKADSTTKSETLSRGPKETPSFFWFSGISFPGNCMLEHKSTVFGGCRKRLSHTLVFEQRSKHQGLRLFRCRSTGFREVLLTDSPLSNLEATLAAD